MSRHPVLELLDFLGDPAANGGADLETPIREKFLAICFLWRDNRFTKNENAYRCDRFFRLRPGRRGALRDCLAPGKRSAQIAWPARIPQARRAAFLRHARA